jgi:hypothetical protein
LNRGWHKEPGRGRPREVSTGEEQSRKDCVTEDEESPEEGEAQESTDPRRWLTPRPGRTDSRREQDPEVGLPDLFFPPDGVKIERRPRKTRGDNDKRVAGAERRDDSSGREGSEGRIPGAFRGEKDPGGLGRRKPLRGSKP